jgi:hypothetical protein
MQRDKNEVTSFYVAITEITRRRASERQSRALFYGLTDSRSNTASQKKHFPVGGASRKFNLVRITLSIKPVQLFKSIPFEAES